MPRLDGTSSYHKYFGTYLEDPSSRLATGKHDYTIKAATAELNRGTTRACKHIPGYAGHIAAHPSNKMTDTIRPMAKVDMCSGPSLDQYMRGDLPGYAGFKPQVPFACNFVTALFMSSVLSRSSTCAFALLHAPSGPSLV